MKILALWSSGLQDVVGKIKKPQPANFPGFRLTYFMNTPIILPN